MTAANRRGLRAAPFLALLASGALLGLGIASSAIGSGSKASDAVPGHAVEAPPWKALMEFPNDLGTLGIATVGELPDTRTHPFFRALGPNGRACATCHRPANAMSISTDTIRKEWEMFGAKAPVFAAVDGSNCPSLPQDRREAHSILLERGAFRIAMPWPPKRLDGTPITPEFTIRVIQDPSGCNTDPVYGLTGAHPKVSVYRRPRMVGNLRYILTPMHESNTKTQQPLDRDPDTGKHVGMSLMSDARVPTLKFQMTDATREHMGMREALSEQQQRQLDDFQRRIYIAQNGSKFAGHFTPTGPKALGVWAMRDGVDHINGNDRDTGVFFNFAAWSKAPGRGKPDRGAAFKASVARGNDIFFLRPLIVSDVTGLNNIRLGNPMKQTCAFCHNTQMTGHDDVPGWMDLGTENFPTAPPNRDLPVFEIVCRPDVAPHPYLGRKIYTNDPGRALVSGKCQDVGGIVMQQFRGMAARAPYFGNGSAKTIRDVVDFYDRRFNIGYSEQDKQDLTNFLSVL